MKNALTNGKHMRMYLNNFGKHQKIMFKLIFLLTFSLLYPFSISVSLRCLCSVRFCIRRAGMHLSAYIALFADAAMWRSFILCLLFRFFFCSLSNFSAHFVAGNDRANAPKANNNEMFCVLKRFSHLGSYHFLNLSRKCCLNI